MRYIRVEWRHDHLDEPIVLYSELDDRSWELRKVEIYRDGRMGFADPSEEKDMTRLGLVPIPDLEEIARSPEFIPIEITPDEFESVWERAHTVVRAG